MPRAPWLLPSEAANVAAQNKTMELERKERVAQGDLDMWSCPLADVLSAANASYINAHIP